MKPVDGDGRVLLRSTLRGQARRLTLASVMLGLYQGGEALILVLIGVVIDRAISVGDADALVLWLVVLALVYLASSVSWRFGLRGAQHSALRAGQRTRIDLTTRVVDACGGADRGRLPGDLVNVATADAMRLGTVCFGLPHAVAGLAGLAVAATSLLLISIPLGLLVLLGTPPLLYLLRLLAVPLQRRSTSEQEQAGRASGIAVDLVSGLRVLKGVGGEVEAGNRYRDVSRSSLAATLRATRAQAWHSGSVLTANGLFLALIALVGGRLAITGEITVGELVAAVGLAQYLVGPLQSAGWFTGLLAQGRASADRIAAVLTAAPAVRRGGGVLPDPVRGQVTLRGVRSGSLSGLDLTVRPGETVGVVADPSDAAALVRCLSRETDPEDGVVELDGVALTSLDPARVRAAMLVAGHDATLFEGSLDDNVRAAADGADVDPAMRASQADEVARAAADGVDSAVSESGRSLSGGQRQRILLARSLAANPPVLVLHDPTTAIDAVTEARIAHGVRELRRGRTTILVTTSPALLAVTDRVITIEDGAGAAEGEHEQLVRGHESYRAVVLA